MGIRPHASRSRAQQVAIKDHEACCTLPRKVSNDVLRQLDREWRGFLAAREVWQADPSKVLGRPGYQATKTSRQAQPANRQPPATQRRGYEEER